MTVKGGTSQACAACKHQRRKCSSDCLLAPYFPATQPKTFQNAHRLFGVSNILKTLKQIDDDDKKADAMKSIIFEADMRQRFPVHGCVEYICYLRFQLQQAEDELRYVRTELARSREQLLKPMDSNDNNNTNNNYIWDADYAWTEDNNNNNNPMMGSSSNSSQNYQAEHYSVTNKALSGLDPILFACSEYNVSPALIFPDNDLIPNEQPVTKEASNSSSKPSSQTDLRNAAAGLSLTRD